MITISQNINNDRCDPIAMMAGKLGGFENSATSFKTCIQDIQPVIYGEIHQSYESMLDNINEIATEMKTENGAFLSKLESDYNTQNTKLNQNLDGLNKSKTNMNTKITETNTSIKTSLDKINNLI